MDAMKRSAEPARLGLVGGLGPLATSFYYGALAESHADAATDMVIIHADLTRVLRLVGEGNLEGLADYLSGQIERLKGAGAQVAAIAAVTPHICMPRLIEKSQLPIIDMIDVLNEHLAGLHDPRVALFGTRPVMETELFGRLRNGMIVKPGPDECQLIHDTYLDVVRGRGSKPEQTKLLRDLAGTLKKRDGVEAIVLAGTELSVLFDGEEMGFNGIDCARLHIAAIVSRLAPA
jgi:aspartate racemase